MNTEQDRAREIIRLLDESAAGTDQKIIDRLSAARQQAVAAHTQARLMPASAGGLAHMIEDYFQHHRAAMIIAVTGAIFIALLLISQGFNSNVVQHGDAFLLGSELPPEAYVDKGFDAWLRDSSD